MRSAFPTIAAAILVIAALIGGVLLFTGRDEASLEPVAPPTAPQPNAGARLPDDLPAGNVLIRYRTGAAHRAVDKLATTLGAVDTPAARAGGQAIVAEPARDLSTDLLVVTHDAEQAFGDANDPAVGAYVRARLGRTG